MNRLGKSWFGFKEWVTSTLIRIVLPDLGAAHRREHRENAYGADSTANGPAHVLVENHGADTTIFSFSSSAMLFAGQPTFQFRGFFNRDGNKYNLVFFRDVYRTAYHIAPDGQSNGLAFFESEVRRLMTELGGTTHIAIGDSAGASAALYFGACCGMDKAVAFSQPFPLTHWLGLGMKFRILFNVPLMVRDWSAWREQAFLAVTIPFAWLEMCQRVGRKGIWNPVEVYRAASPRPEAVLFFGEGCGPDSRTARLLADVPEARLMPLPTARHSVGLYLAKRGELQRLILREIEAAVSKASVPNVVSQ